MSEPASNCRKMKWGWRFLEKETKAKISMKYIKTNLHQLKEIVVFISQIIVVPRPCNITINATNKQQVLEKTLS